MANIVLNTLTGSELPNEGIQDALQTVLTGGTYVTISYNDGANTYTFDLSTEALMDFLANNFLVAGSNVTLTYNDGANTLTIAATGGGASNLDGLTDVVITSPTIHSELRYDGANWIDDDRWATLRLLDYFNSGVATAGQLGNLGWDFSGGTATVTSLTIPSGEAGIVRRACSTTGGTIARTNLRLGGSTGASFLPALNFDILFRFQMNNNDSDTVLHLGLASDWTSITPANHIVLHKKAADTSWFGSCRDGSEQRTPSAVAACDTNIHTARIRRIDASTVGFTIDGGTEQTVAAHIPTAALQPGWLITNNGAAADKTVDMFRFRMVLPGLTA